MDFGALYYMRDAMLHGAFRASAGPGVDDMAITRAETHVDSPLVLRHFMGGGPRDLIGTGHVSLILVSERIVQTLRAGAFSGWTTYPIKLLAKNGDPIVGYHGLAVTGRCGPVLWRKGRKIRKPPPVPQGHGYDAWVGFYFDPDTWDGSDIFMPEATTYKIVSKRVMEALTRAKVTNVKFTPLTEFERSWPV